MMRLRLSYITSSHKRITFLAKRTVSLGRVDSCNYITKRDDIYQKIFLVTTESYCLNCNEADILKVTESHLLPRVFNTIQNNLLTESVQGQFLKDCTTIHAGPIFSNKGFYGILSLKTILNSNIDWILPYCWYHRYIICRNKKYVSDKLCTERGCSSSNYPHIRLNSSMLEYNLEANSKL